MKYIFLKTTSSRILQCGLQLLRQKKGGHMATLIQAIYLYLKININ